MVKFEQSKNYSGGFDSQTKGNSTERKQTKGNDTEGNAHPSHRFSGMGGRPTAAKSNYYQATPHFTHEPRRSLFIAKEYCLDCSNPFPFVLFIFVLCLYVGPLQNQIGERGIPCLPILKQKHFLITNVIRYQNNIFSQASDLMALFHQVFNYLRPIAYLKNLSNNIKFSILLYY